MWVKLTDLGKEEITVNMDNVLFISTAPNDTAVLHFVGGRKPELQVEEAKKQIDPELSAREIVARVTDPKAPRPQPPRKFI